MRHLLAAALTVTIIGFVSIAEAQTGWTGIRHQPFRADGDRPDKR